MAAAPVAREPRANAPRTGRECRVYERHACGLETACQPIAARSDKDIVWRATVRDLWFEGTSHDGQLVRVPVRRLFLTGAWPLTAGTTLRMWVGDKASHAAEVRVRVVECREQPEGWTVTYRPVEPLSVQALRSL